MTIAYKELDSPSPFGEDGAGDPVSWKFNVIMSKWRKYLVI